MMHSLTRTFGAVLLAILFGGRLCASETSFFEEVVPIFQRRCIGCHNDGESKGDFSIQSAKRVMASGHLEPGDVESSRLFEVLVPVDGKAEMPKDADPLTSGEIQTIRKWIEEGAEWPSEAALSDPAISDFDWWSLKPLKRPNVPGALDDAGIRSPIDAFIAAKLQEKGLAPSPSADGQTLVRRLYFDLLGLPPTPVQVTEFNNDSDPRAYERLVDRLLDSEHYGERWARHWLDVVHYADTHGYDKDKLRPNAWPYRDYVIRSLNEDKQYTRFVQEQIAGDVLWPNTRDGITATGFIAAGPWDFIGHAEVPETKIDGRIARHLDRDDMVASTMNTFASTTVQCARCHNHKFDPVTQEHYYSLQAIFAALDRADRVFDLQPDVARNRQRLNDEQERVYGDQTRLETELKRLGGEKLEVFDARIASLENELKESTRPEFGYHSELSEDQDVVKWVQVDLGSPKEIDRIEVVGAHDTFGGIGHGFGFPLRYKIEAAGDATFTKDVSTIFDRTNSDFANPGTTPQTFKAKEGTRGSYVRITATRLALRGDKYIFSLGELRVLDSDQANLAKGKTVSSLDSIESPSRWARENLVDDWWYGKAASSDLAQQIADTRLEREAYIKSVVPKELRKEAARTGTRLKEIKDELGELPAPSKVYAGTIHSGSGAFKGTGSAGGKPRTIHVLHRGEILQPRKLVGPGRIPVAREDDWRFDLPQSHTEGESRVALARWLTAPDNPLVWRSIVNRVWQYHFGRGIVDTPNDFGRMGAKPSHPELLDWLAMEFRDGGQSLKQLHKLIVTSAVYRQQSLHNDDNAMIDSGNQYLWRMNRRRLSAEEVRDAVLHVSGTLNRKMYGPGIRLFELERPEHSPHYEYHKHDPNDPNSHRRTIYRFIVRSQPDPFMTTLDCADSSQSVAKRDETVTALQALSLMNNKFMLAMAERFAERVATDTLRRRKQAAKAFRLATGHAPTKQQTDMLVSYLQEHGLENTCRLLFNLNEFVFVD